MSDKCFKCSKPVYAMEKVVAIGKSYHKTCLKCNACSRSVNNGNWCEHDGLPYCNNCYETKFVDNETKQIIYEMETNYSKKVHGTGKALPGMGGPSGFFNFYF